MSNSSNFENFSGPVAKLVALVTTFFFFPFAFENTVGIIVNFTSQHYGNGLAEFTRISWMALCALLIFTLCQFVLSLALRLIPLLFVSRR